MCDANEISRSLAEWAVKEMGFRGPGKDMVESKKVDLSGICLGPLTDVWMYVIKHVKDESTVQTIQGNLRLNSRVENEDPQKLALMRQREMLKEEIAELKKTTNVLHDSLVESKLLVQQKEKELRNQQLTFRDLKRSSYLLNLVRTNTEHKVQSLNKTSIELEKHFQSFSPALEKEADLERYKIDVENMSKLMKNSLSELLNEEPNIEKLSATKMTVGNNLASLLEALPRRLFMKLIQEQQQTEISSNSDKDSSSSPDQKNAAFEFIPENSKAQPLQKLLHELSWVKADTRARADKARSQISTLSNELDQLKSQVLQRLILLSDGDEHKLAIGQKLLEMEIQVASRKSAVDALRTNLEELDNFCSRYEARQAEIEQKIITIERNSRLSDHLTALTCTLARKRANNPRLVQQFANQSQKIVNEEINTICKELGEKIQLSKSNIEKELEICRQLKPSQLFNVQMENKLVPVNRLAINRLFVASSESNGSGTHLETTLKYLGLPRTLSVFRVLEAVGDKRLQIRKTQQTLKWHENRKSEIAEKHDLSWLTNGSILCKELAKKLEDSRSALEGTILPSVESRRKRINEAAKCIEDIEIALQEWCDEPAKVINTGRIVNGQSLEQWSAVWKKSLNLCRKKVN